MKLNKLLLKTGVGLSLLTTVGVFSNVAQALTFDEQIKQMGLSKDDVTINDVNIGKAKELVINSTGERIYFNENMDKAIAGKLYNISKEGQFTDPAFAKLENYADTMIVHKAPNEKYVVTAFVDITCHYCQLLHKNVKEYNDLGITMRYLAFPREGLDGQVAKQMEAIFTAKDKAQAYSDAENGKLPKAEEYKTPNIVKKHFDLGLEFGITGTPALILQNGQVIPGYLKPEQLLKALEQAQK